MCSQVENSIHQPGIHSKNVKEPGHSSLRHIVLHFGKVRCLKGYGAIS